MQPGTLIQISLEIWGAIFCLICIIITLIGSKLHQETWQNNVLLFLTEIVMFCSDALLYIYVGDTSVSGKYIYKISYFLIFFSSSFFSFFYKEYLKTVLNEKQEIIGKKLDYCLNVCFLFIIIFLILNLRTGYMYQINKENYCEYKAGYLIYLAYLLTGGGMVAGTIIKNRKYISKEKKRLLLSTLCIMIAAVILQRYFLNGSIANISLLVVMLINYISYQMNIIRGVYIKDVEIERKKAEAAEYKTRMITSQIHPHFLFNSLNAIKALAGIDQNECIKAVDYLSEFLRGSLDAVNSNELITIDREFEITNAYLNMQKYRFGDSLTIELQNKSDGFLLPPFTIQPLVENSIHAIRAKEDGSGTIKIIASSIEGECHKIVIADTGTGFDPEQIKKDRKGHYGIKIVHERIEKMMGGNMNIQSKIGEGTVITICLPWRKEDTV